ncbi:MAG: STAS domain-containing protein, partial [Chlamydiia bacterium]|nr:STAS domain-containing protein [Chlamydiia bacterium]
LLLSTTKKLKGVSGGLHLCSVSEEVMEIIKMAGFERIIHIFPTEQEALQGFSN